MKKTVLFVNAGHGGRDPKTGEYTTPASNGKRCMHTNGKEYHNKGWFFEGVVNRQLAALFIAEATALGYTCIPVYDAIADTSLEARVKIANDAHLRMGVPTFWISFHSNAFKGETRGWNAYHMPGNMNSREIATKAGARVNQYFNAKGSINNEYVREGYGWRNGERFVLYELLNTKMPALLFEWLFFDNPLDADLLMMPEVREDSVSILAAELAKLLP
jgi:N-acetylmuramoyl-L-alanine amidase